MPLTFRIVARLLQTLFYILTRCQITGKENIPRQGPLIIVANHLHNVDPPLVGAFIPRLVNYMAKEELFQSRLLSPIIRWFRAFPVRRGQTDMKALRQADKILEQGMALAIFPEGKRSINSQLEPAELGAAFIALHSGAPLLPIGITGTEKFDGKSWLWRRPRIIVNIGPTFNLPNADGRLTKNTLALSTENIMRHIAALLPSQYRGVYGENEVNEDIIPAGWKLPELPPTLKDMVTVNNKSVVSDIGIQLKARLASQRNIEEKARLEQSVLDWLYDLITLNIRRGRVFELKEALMTGHADCLGYVKIFQTLGHRFGLNLGMVEVVVDNAGRYVPHQAILCLLASGARYIVDPWYGSRNIRHRRWTVQIIEAGRWRIKDLNDDELIGQKKLKGLPDECITALTCYIRGNQYLEAGMAQQREEELDKAIECYDQAIRLYPTNARFYFNRAVAFERRGKQAQAELDYQQALKDEDGQIRVLANVADMEKLIALDDKGITPQDQQIYLWHKGYMTGREITPEEIANRCNTTEEAVTKILSQINIP